ncbi:MAG: NADPH:quinone oxidoreductase family protein [Pseudomonadota bacterium]
MKAFVCHTLSDDLFGTGIQDLPAPEPGPGEIRVRVKATSVNYPDILLCQGKYQLKLEPPFTPGMDISGVVDAVGVGVTEHAPGDEVVGGARFGGFAEFITVPGRSMRRKPFNLSFAQAAAIPAAYLTAYVALIERANLQEGETLLVHGATGGVGLAAVDVGRLLGAKVIATSGSKEKLFKLVEYGAGHGVLADDGMKHAIKTMTQNKGVDVVFDPVGGDIFDQSTRCMAFNGRLLVVGFTSGRIATVPSNIPLIKGFSVVGVRAGEYSRQFPERGEEILRHIWMWAEDGKINPLVHAEYPLSETRQAFQALLDRSVFGKVIVSQA